LLWRPELKEMRAHVQYSLAVKGSHRHASVLGEVRE